MVLQNKFWKENCEFLISFEFVLRGTVVYATVCRFLWCWELQGVSDTPAGLSAKSWNTAQSNFVVEYQD